MVSRVLASNAVQTLILRVPAPPPGDAESNRWPIASELMWVMWNALKSAPPDDGGTPAMALVLLGSGAVTYCAATLAAVAALPGPPPHRPLGRLLTLVLMVVRTMVETGDTGADPAVRAQGAEPRNIFLADFDAAGGCDALVKLIQSEQALASARDEAMQLHELLVSILGDVAKGEAEQLVHTTVSF